MSQISRFTPFNGISQTTLWKILYKDLGLHPYRIKLTQELKPLDHLKRRNFRDWALQNGPVEWPPRSCDLTPVDFFLCGHVKLLIYANKQTTLEKLRKNIKREIANISADVCQRVVQNWLQRIDCCKCDHGGHMVEIEFHS